jgi:pimeloyl-ACP methyl ester carboxylesterase
MRRSILVVCMAVLWTFGGPARALHLEGRVVGAGKQKLWIGCAGTGAPTLVIDVGLGGDPREWSRVVQDVRNDVRVCQYERAGYGQSEPGPFPRDARREGEELLKVLEEAGEKPPYLLVGHSLGAVNAYVLAGAHRDALAGLALLHPLPLGWIAGKEGTNVRLFLEKQREKYHHVAKQLAASPAVADKIRAARFLAMDSEQEMLVRDSAKQAAAVTTLGSLPVLVVAAKRPNPILGPDRQTYQDRTIEEGRRLAARSTNGKFVLLEESGEMMQRDAPDKVADAIRELLGRIRAAQPPTAAKAR